MARPSKRKVPGGGDPRKQTSSSTSHEEAPSFSNRYTPPSGPDFFTEPSPVWVPILMFTFFGLGLLSIILNYAGVMPGGNPSNTYLGIGLLLILAGIITATRLR